jgi:hypothetical protein
METTGGDDHDNTTEKNATMAVMDNTTPSDQTQAWR